MIPFIAAVPEALKVPDVGQALSGIFGSVSLTAWICLLLPQLITNYKAKSADALSMKFLLIWLLGDMANLSGALFTSLAPSTIALASYFCVADLILISQCTYYNTINARRREHLRRHHHRHHHHHHQHPHDGDDNRDASTSAAPPLPPSETDPLLPNGHHQNGHHHPNGSARRLEPRRRDSATPADPLERIITSGGEDGAADGGSGGSAWLANTVSLLAVWAVGAAGWFVSYKVGAWGVGGGGGSGDGGGDGEVLLLKEPVAVVGMVLGYASAVCYLCARIPQIIKNYREKSCEGLALLFFLLSLTGNFTYGASVMAYCQDRDYFVRALPWLLGSLGTMVEDSIIFVQFRIYSPKRQPKAGGSA